MSLYYVQKFLFELNRDPDLQARYTADRAGVLDPYELTDEERTALTTPDIGLLFHLGVNGQILMHFAALHQIPWADYLQLMRDGIAEHGPVREGVYAMTGYEGVDAHSASLGQRSHAAAHRGDHAPAPGDTAAPGTGPPPDARVTGAPGDTRADSDPAVTGEDH